MQHETNPRGLSYPIRPLIIIDDLIAGTVNVSLSPEIPVSSFFLKQCFENVPFKKQAKQDWIKVLREIADELELKG